jgi:hypothetical protein
MRPLCAHCGNPVLDGRRRTFCRTACRTAAFRRRQAGVPESFAAGGGRRGRLSLAEAFERDQLERLGAELEATRLAASESDWSRLGPTA